MNTTFTTVHININYFTLSFPFIQEKFYFKTTGPSKESDGRRTQNEFRFS